MTEQIDVASLLAVTSEKVRANSQDGNLLPSDALPEVVSDVMNFLSTAHLGEPLPTEIRNLPSVQLLQVLVEIQKQTFNIA